MCEYICVYDKNVADFIMARRLSSPLNIKKLLQRDFSTNVGGYWAVTKFMTRKKKKLRGRKRIYYKHIGAEKTAIITRQIKDMAQVSD